MDRLAKIQAESDSAPRQRREDSYIHTIDEIRAREQRLAAAALKREIALAKAEMPYTPPYKGP